MSLVLLPLPPPHWLAVREDAERPAHGKSSSSSPAVEKDEVTSGLSEVEGPLVSNASPPPRPLRRHPANPLPLPLLKLLLPKVLSLHLYMPLLVLLLLSPLVAKSSSCSSSPCPSCVLLLPC
eukprot:419572-Hanusia_phi.AAC.2